MAISLIVDGQTFNYPENFDEAGWGEEAAAWASAVTDVLTGISGPGDILPQTFSVADNIGVATNVTNFFFDPLVVRGAIAEYSIYRNSDSDERCEVGMLYLAYKTVANAWELVQTKAGSSGVTLTITSAGQIQYTSDSMGSGHSGVLKFRARAFTQ